MKEISQTIIRTGQTQRLTEPGEIEQQVKDMKRTLARAEQKIRKLQEQVADQKQQVRELHAQAKHADNLSAEREEFKAEIADLRSETRELTRANREHVEKIETLRAENAKLKAEAKAGKLTGRSVGTDVQGLLYPLLS